MIKISQEEYLKRSKKLFLELEKVLYKEEPNIFIPVLFGMVGATLNQAKGEEKKTLQKLLLISVTETQEK